jgi:MFS transporter, DHA1 family, multidrug resistance protein
MQLYLAIPTRIVEITHRNASVSVIFLVLSVLIIAFQVPMNRWVGKFPLVQSVQAGFLLMAAGLLVLGYAPTIFVFVGGIVLFAFGMMTIEPASFDLTARLSNREMTATYFGFYYLAMAVGGGLSQGTGGLLLQVGQSVGQPALIWWITTIVALASVFGARPLRKSVRDRSHSEVTMVE